MAKLPKMPAHWNLVTSALNGALLGLLAAVTHSFAYAFYGDIPKEDLVVHVFTQTTLVVSAGAISFAVVSAIHNWLNNRSKQSKT